MYKIKDIACDTEIVKQCLFLKQIGSFIGISALLFSFGSLVIALLAFLDKRNKHK